MPLDRSDLKPTARPPLGLVEGAQGERRLHVSASKGVAPDQSVASYFFVDGDEVAVDVGKAELLGTPRRQRERGTGVRDATRLAVAVQLLDPLNSQAAGGRSGKVTFRSRGTAVRDPTDAPEPHRVPRWRPPSRRIQRLR